MPSGDRLGCDFCTEIWLPAANARRPNYSRRMGYTAVSPVSADMTHSAMSLIETLTWSKTVGRHKNGVKETFETKCIGMGFKINFSSFHNWFRDRDMGQHGPGLRLAGPGGAESHGSLRSQESDQIPAAQEMFRTTKT